MLAPLQLVEQLMARIQETLSPEDLCAPDDLLSLALPLPHRITAAPQLSGPQFHFGHAHRQELHAGYGIAREWQARGPERLEILGEQARRLHWRQLDPDDTGEQGCALLGIASSPMSPGTDQPDGLPNALFWIPELALRTRAEQSTLILTTRLPAERSAVLGHWREQLEQVLPALDQPTPEPRTPASLTCSALTPDQDGWAGMIQAALEEIASGRMRKLVLSRHVQLRSQRPLDLARLESGLAYLYPSCQVVHLRRGDHSLVAATPERLFTQRGTRIEADALAGTASRCADAAGDAELTAELLASAKNLHEHQVVADAVIDGLRDFCTHLDAPDGPQILQLSNVQHLWTRIRGELHPGTDAFRLTARLHPTPATNGQPRQAAHDWLRRTEPFERGWYTGTAGLVEADLSGEMWVLLRYACIHNDTADLYAGAGIVPGSDPDEEWQETEHKLAALATALQFA